MNRIPLVLSLALAAALPLAAQPTDGELVTQYTFDDGTGTSLTNAKNPNQKSTLTDVEWIKPGYKDSAAALGFNGQTSRLDLPGKSNPNGPIAIQIAVRPKAYDGLFLADVGGMTIGTKADGKPFFMRINADGKWAFASGTAALPLDKWSLIQARWDGTKIQIFIDGTLGGEAPCGAQFSSARTSLGYNPYGKGSQYFRGDLDAFEVRSLPTPP